MMDLAANFKGFRTLLTVVLMLNALVGLGQSVGDYQSNIGFGNTGNWSTLATWQRYNGSAWVTPTGAQGYPGQFSVPNVVTFSEAVGTLTLDVSPPKNIGTFTTNGFIGIFNTSGNVNLTINTAFNLGTLDFFIYAGTGNFTVLGTSQISGTYTGNNGSGTTTFTGLATVTGTFISTSISATPNLVFNGGIANTGTFSGGGATFNTSNQIISGSGNVSFANNVAITGITLTLTNTANFSVTGTTTLTTSGGFTDSNNSGVTTFIGNVSVGASTSFITTAVATPANLIFRGGIANAGVFTAGGATFNSAAQSITGTSNLSFANNVVITGITLTMANTGNLSITGTTTGSGSFTDSNNSGIDTFTGNVNLTGAFTTSAVTTSSNIVFQGGITSSGASFTAGGATFNTGSQSITGTTNASFFNTVIVVPGITVTNSNTTSVTMSNSAAGTLQGTGTWTQGANSTLIYYGSNIAISTFNASNLGNTVNYFSTATPQSIFNPSASTYYHLTLSGAGNQIKTLLANTIVSGNLSILNTAIFSVNTFSLSVAGNWSNSSTNADPFVEGTQTVTFNGTAAQTITNTGNANGTVFNNVVINNTFGTSPQLTLAGNVVVGGSGTLTMTQGNINLNAKILTIGTAAATPGTLSHTGSSSNGWAYGGTFTRYFNTGTIADGSVTGFFPMGSSTDFRPFYVSNPATGISTGGSISLTHTGVATTSNSSITDGGSTILLRSDSYWTCSSAGIVSGGNFNLNAGGTGFGTVGDVNDLRLCLAASVVGTAGTNSGTLTSPLVQRTGLTTANLSNNFYIGSVNWTRTPLPIQLISFTGTAKSYGVDLQWNTQSELNNDYFTVLHSSTGSNFVPISKVPGSGTTNAPHTYSLTDYHPASGLNYYQLQQTDFDGKVSTFEVIAVIVTGDLNPVKIYPNPVAQSQDLNVELSGLTANVPALLQVMNMQGTSLVQAVVNTDETGSLKTAVASGGLVPGVYILTVGGVHYKFIVK
ncbi:MAG: hypothetical protein JSS93_03170 [Bacteroidetes bacterium]|nr:hypothetical protein [Bacteroidota bacterium]